MKSTTLFHPLKPDQLLGYLLFFCGFCSFLYGCWRVSPPLAFILGGLILAVLGYLAGLDPYHLKDKDW